MDYEIKFLLFKKLIDETFSDYEKKYYFNKTYEVIFTFQNRNIRFTILPDSKWFEFKKKIKDKLAILSSDPYCNVCFESCNKLLHCDRCTFIICDDCFHHILKNKGTYFCYQCGFDPFAAIEEEEEEKEDEDDFARNQWMKILSVCI